MNNERRREAHSAEAEGEKCRWAGARWPADFSAPPYPVSTFSKWQEQDDEAGEDRSGPVLKWALRTGVRTGVRAAVLSVPRGERG
jgi:hypothetical protein